MLKIRGTGLVKYNATTVTVEDAASQALNNRQKWELNLPIAVDGTFVQALADYILAEYKDSAFRYSVVDFQNLETVGGVNVYSLDLGQIISIAEYQNGVSGLKYLVTGYNCVLKPGSAEHSIAYNVMKLDTPTGGYGKFDDAVLGTWDNCSFAL